MFCLRSPTIRNYQPTVLEQYRTTQFLSLILLFKNLNSSGFHTTEESFQNHSYTLSVREEIRKRQKEANLFPFVTNASYRDLGKKGS